MKRARCLLTVLALACVGCDAQLTPGPAGAANQPAPPVGDGVEAGSDSNSGENLQLTPLNTTIQFVCAHKRVPPEPRTGTFEEFTGTAIVDGGSLTAVQVEIETASLRTDIDKLTDHLKNADFFDALEYPKATFKSTKIEADQDGQVNITGDLTLLDVTKSITFPAAVSSENGLTLESEFTIDRTEFGMDFGMDEVEEEVTLTISVNL